MLALQVMCNFFATSDPKTNKNNKKFAIGQIKILPHPNVIPLVEPNVCATD